MVGFLAKMYGGGGISGGGDYLLCNGVGDQLCNGGVGVG